MLPSWLVLVRTDDLYTITSFPAIRAIRTLDVTECNLPNLIVTDVETLELLNKVSP